MKQFQKQRDWTPRHWRLELSSRWRTSGRGLPERGCMTASVPLMARTAWSERWEGLYPLFPASWGVLGCPCRSVHPLSLSFHCSTGSIYFSVAGLLWMYLSDVQVQSPFESAHLVFWFCCVLTGILVFLIYMCFITQSGSFHLCRRWKELELCISIFINLLPQLIRYLLIVLSYSDFIWKQMPINNTVLYQ